MHLVGEKAMEGPPDLCVEIISPTSETIDRKLKFKQYEKFGVAHYWIVDPAEHTVEAFKLVKKKYQPAGSGKDSEVLRLPPFMDLEIRIATLWLPPRKSRPRRRP